VEQHLIIFLIILVHLVDQAAGVARLITMLATVTQVVQEYLVRAMKVDQAQQI
jgi:hypothetical protein